MTGDLKIVTGGIFGCLGKECWPADDVLWLTQQLFERHFTMHAGKPWEYNWHSDWACASLLSTAGQQTLLW